MSVTKGYRMLRRTHRIYGLGVCLGVVLSALVGARETPQGSPSDPFALAKANGRDVIRHLMAADDVPGMSVAVGIDGRLVWTEGFGFADLAQQQAVDRKTRFRLGSVSKLLTVAAAARLFEAGKLDFDAPVQVYLPTYPQQAEGMTTRRLMGHLGGIRHYLDRDHLPGHDIDEQHFEDTTAALGIFATDPLVASPGTRYWYSTFGFTVVTAVVERASRKPYLQELQKSVLAPLQMTDTTADDPRVAMSARSSFYDRHDNGLVGPAGFVDPSYKWGGGGLVSTSEDLVRFGTAHLAAGFFKIDTLRLLFTSQRTLDGHETGVGLGWRIEKNPDGRTYVHHTGNMQGCRALLWLDRDAGIVVAMLSNLGGRPQNLEEEARGMARWFRLVHGGHP
jgi:serine beta-lactamase-like protein LACTB